ncbi:hypothetical protein Hanom_Chr00s118942g01810871 [Helianthus anomalus]
MNKGTTFTNDQGMYNRLTWWESFKANVEVERKQFLKMRKEIEEDHERKKAELEAMQKEFDSQRQKLEAVMQKVMKRLHVRDQDE